MAIAGEVPLLRCRLGSPPRRLLVHRQGLEGPVAVAEQHGHVRSGELVGSGEVEAAVAGEVARHSSEMGTPTGEGDLRLEGASPSPRYPHTSLEPGVDDAEVDPSITVEVASHNPPGVAPPHRVRDGGLESAVAVA